MKKKLIALAAIIGGVIALVIAQSGGQDEWAAVGQGVGSQENKIPGVADMDYGGEAAVDARKYAADANVESYRQYRAQGGTLDSAQWYAQEQTAGRSK